MKYLYLLDDFLNETHEWFLDHRHVISQVLRVVEGVLGTVILFWGLWMFLPFQTVSERNYGYFYEIGLHDLECGLLATLTGIGKMSGALYDHLLLRKWGSVLGLIVLGSIAGGLMISNPTAGGIPIYATLACWSAIIRICQE